MALARGGPVIEELRSGLAEQAGVRQIVAVRQNVAWVQRAPFANGCIRGRGIGRAPDARQWTDGQEQQMVFHRDRSAVIGRPAR
jgi:hypothetical protein